MAEIISYNPEYEGGESDESRFGDKEAVKNSLENGSAEVMGRLEDYYDIPKHRNVVEMAYVNYEQVITKGVSEFVTIRGEDGDKVEAVFKPIDGEDEKFHNENGLGHDYPREAASYLVSEHFDFDLVPPTVYRTLNGRTGSLQLFLPQEKFGLGGEGSLTLDEEGTQKFMDSKDMLTLNVFDWIIANSDRHGDNYMMELENGGVKLSNDGVTLAAIDNGGGFNELFYRLKANRGELAGPYQFLTVDTKTKESVSKNIPDDLLAKIKEGYARKDELNEALLSLPDIDGGEIDLMWKRIEGLIESGVFLSGSNCPEHIEYP